ncbi:GGDEF domain-containing protein [Thermosulfurimonas sp. F29]|uniref:sensor domain-containing diguanylate cyclase n=1 Tax=Thermosulfurimonas sp. F29 TaxID=2867247 RepID=UPI001C83E706|nr:GGDEF domain-containing protein [Thermosulfurimonas sp. F29]MBX6422802.1 GGDEF domain-containing protein [Thermosulfurimonas sp. F29]
MNFKKVEELLDKRRINLPSPPALAIRLLESVREEDYKRLAETIRLDPALAARVLGLANSQLYRTGATEITSIETALSLLGTDVIKNMALSFAVAHSFPRKGRSYGFDLERFWKRAVTNAVSARLLAQRISLEDDHLFTAGLLMDLGVLLLHLILEEEYARVFDEKEVSEKPLWEVEQALLGFTHAEAGAYLFRRWHLPEHIIQDVCFHHRWEEAPEEFREHARLLSMAALLGGIYFSEKKTVKYNRALREIPKFLGISGEDTEALIDQVARECQEIFSFFDLPVENIPPYSELVEEAHQELERLSLNCALILRQLKEEKARAEELAHRLREANERLRLLSILDGLTELYNHRYFQERLREEFERARRYRRSISLIMLDIDHFKKINDTYGHLAGDFILRGLSRLIRENIRKSDIPARYGGEEFAIILPETDLRGASVLGERLREKVAQEPFYFEEHAIRVTISVGVASCFPSMNGTDPRKLLETADKALYYSKTHGRNRLTAVIVH